MFLKGGHHEEKSSSSLTTDSKTSGYQQAGTLAREISCPYQKATA